MHMRFVKALLGTFFISLFSCSHVSAERYDLDYQVHFDPKTDLAKVEIVLSDADKVSVIDFNLKRSQCHEFRSPSKIEKKKNHRLLWHPEGKVATIRYQCNITHKREKQNGKASYDALMTDSWVIFRGDDLVPPARVRVKKGWKSKAKITFNLPKAWPSINTEWERDLSLENSTTFFVDNPERSFDRPTGWMIAGKLGTRRAKLVDGDHVFRIAVSAPLDSEFRRMDVLTFMQFIWPEFQKAFGIKPKKVLIVGGGDPLWRGGLSAGNSFYMHEDRPIISENGTSTLTHEMFHMLTGIRGSKGHDWIAEGLAEFYSLNLIKRAGGMNESRYQYALKKLRTWSKDVESLTGKQSKGKTTAAAVILFDQLNKEVLTLTQQKSDLDDIVVELLALKRIDINNLKTAFKKVTGKSSKHLSSTLISGKEK